MAGGILSQLARGFSTSDALARRQNRQFNTLAFEEAVKDSKLDEMLRLAQQQELDRQQQADALARTALGEVIQNPEALDDRTRAGVLAQSPSVLAELANFQNLTAPPQEEQLSASNLVEVQGPDGPLFMNANDAQGLAPAVDAPAPTALQQNLLLLEQLEKDNKTEAASIVRNKLNPQLQKDPQYVPFERQNADGTTQKGFVNVLSPNDPFIAVGAPVAANANKKQTATQLKARGMVDRMTNANQAIKGLDFTPREGGRFIPNRFKSDERQLFEQATGDWANAFLRKESGATIKTEETQEVVRIYWPQPGDSEEVLKQKAAARQIAEASIRMEAGEDLQQEPAPPAPDEDGAPSFPIERDGVITTSSGATIKF